MSKESDIKVIPSHVLHHVLEVKVGEMEKLTEEEVEDIRGILAGSGYSVVMSYYHKKYNCFQINTRNEFADFPSATEENIIEYLSGRR